MTDRPVLPRSKERGLNMEAPPIMSDGWLLGMFPDTGFPQKIIAFGNAVQAQRDQMWVEMLEPFRVELNNIKTIAYHLGEDKRELEEKCDELASDKGTYYRLYERACTTMQTDADLLRLALKALEAAHFHAKRKIPDASIEVAVKPSIVAIKNRLNIDRTK